MHLFNAFIRHNVFSSERERLLLQRIKLPLKGIDGSAESAG